MKERRANAGKLEFRGEGMCLTGYASVFNRDSKPICGLFVERVAPGAFTRTLKDKVYDVRALFNHESNELLGRLGAGTLRLSEDENGLFTELELPDTQRGRDVAALVKRGDIYGMSFAFRAIKESWEDRGSDMPLRTLLDCDLYDVSPVTDPAYEDTTVAVRGYTDRQASLVILPLMKMRLAVAERLQ